MKGTDPVKQIKAIISDRSELLGMELQAAVQGESSEIIIEILTAQVSLLEEIYLEIENLIEDV
jgi:hypothetical protein